MYIVWTKTYGGNYQPHEFPAATDAVKAILNGDVKPDGAIITRSCELMVVDVREKAQEPAPHPRPWPYGDAMPEVPAVPVSVSDTPGVEF